MKVLGNFVWETVISLVINEAALSSPDILSWLIMSVPDRDTPSYRIFVDTGKNDYSSVLKYIQCAPFNLVFIWGDPLQNMLADMSKCK